MAEKGASKGGGGGGGGRNGLPPAFVLRFKNVQLSETPTRLRLIPTSPDDAFYLYYQRWAEVNGKRSPVISNSHNGAKNVPDLVFWQSVETDNPDLLANPTYAISALVLEQFHKTQVPAKKPDKDGKPRTFEKLVRCQGVDIRGRSKCDMCKDNVPTQFGDIGYITLSSAQKDQLVGLLEQLPSRCAGCFKGEAIAFAYECPECQHVLLDRYQDENATDDDMAFLYSATADCPNCHKNVWATPIYECQEKQGNEYAKGCDKPQQIGADSIFGYDIRVAWKKGSKGVAAVISIPSFSEQKEYEIGATLKQPMPFDYFLSHMPLDEQARALGIINPFGAEEAAEVLSFFSQSTRPVASGATPEEADAHSVPWGGAPEQQ